MKVAGLIAEYNPFHNGHKYQLDQIRQRTQADYIVVALSGNFLQRGVPAIADKYLRTDLALSCGADLVLEIPALWATASASYYAHGGVSLLSSLGLVDYLCFGAETDSLEDIQKCAHSLTIEDQDFSQQIRFLQKKGLSYPAARQKALSESQNKLFTKPNNILAMEYCKALEEAGNKLSPVLIQRLGDGYNSTSPQSLLASATSVRKLIHEELDFHQLVPEEVYKSLCTYENELGFVKEDKLSDLLLYKLLSQKDYSEYADISLDLNHKIQKHIRAYQSFDKLCDSLKSKDITRTRISRGLCHILLDITKSDYSSYIKKPVPYIRVLGFNKKAAPLLNTMKNKASVPVITKPADADRVLDSSALYLLQKDIYCSDVYNLLLAGNHKQIPANDYTHQLIIKN